MGKRTVIGMRGKSSAIDTPTVIGIVATILLVAFLFVGLPILFPTTVPKTIFINAMTLSAAWLGLMGMLRMQKFMGQRSKHLGGIWRFFVCGVFLWLLGDAIYAFYAIVLHIALPFPSFADVSYVLGTIVLILGMMETSRYLARSLLPAERLLLVFTALLGFITIGYVLMPVIMSSAISPLEKALYLIYPCGGVLIAIMTFSVFLQLHRTPAGFVWSIFLLGFILFAVSDLWFAYLTAWNLYNEWDAVGYLYASSYLLWFCGAILLEWLYRGERPLIKDFLAH